MSSAPSAVRIDALLSALREKPLVHGRRVSYMRGCRCLPCRAANARHATERLQRVAAGESAHLVSADAARSHIRELSLIGVGRDAVGKAAQVSNGVICSILSGQRQQVRATTEKRILAVDGSARADGAHIDAGPTWEILDRLVAQGYLKSQIARWLGAKSPALQISRRLVTVAHAKAVKDLAGRLVDGKLIKTDDELDAEAKAWLEGRED